VSANPESSSPKEVYDLSASYVEDAAAVTGNNTTSLSLLSSLLTFLFFLSFFSLLSLLSFPSSSSFLLSFFSSFSSSSSSFRQALFVHPEP